MKDREHIVIDLETLGLKPNALVLSIGYAIVKNAQVVQVAEHRLLMEEQEGRHIDQSTVRWWLDGEKADAQRHLSSLPEIKLDVAMAAMTANVCAHSSWSDILVWGNSPSFDCVILTDLLRGVGKYREAPWRFYNERDLRTLRAMAPSHERVRPSVPHSAMYDALAEAEELCNYLRTLP